ncbi:MAG: hypothetical protein QM808_11340 [Steroidobacteraceae bacterium]
MIALRLKSLRQIFTATTSGTLQLFVLAFFIALSALIIVAAKGKLVPFIPTWMTIVGCFFWFMMGSGCVLTAHHAHQFRLAGVGRQVVRALLLLYVFFSVMPALFTHSFISALAINTMVASAILLILMLPSQWVGFVWLAPMLFASKLGLRQYLPSDLSQHPDALWCVALLMLGLTWLRWKFLRQQDCNIQRGTTLLTAMRGGANISFGSSSSMQRVQFSWLSPRVSSRNARTYVDRLRTLLGMNFSPGAWQRHACFVFVLFLAMTLYMEVTRKPSVANPFLRESFLAFMASIMPLTVSFQAQLLYRRESHDLAELALLPILPGDQKLNWLKRAALRALSLNGFGLMVVLLLLSALFQQMSLAKFIIVAGSLALSIFAGLTRFINIAVRPQSEHIFFRSLLWMFAIMPGPLTWYLAIRNMQTHNNDAAVVSLFVLTLWLAILGWLHLRWHRQLAERPHPFVEVVS